MWVTILHYCVACNHIDHGGDYSCILYILFIRYMLKKSERATGEKNKERGGGISLIPLEFRCPSVIVVIPLDDMPAHLKVIVTHEQHQNSSNITGTITISS